MVAYPFQNKLELGTDWQGSMNLQSMHKLINLSSVLLSPEALQQVYHSEVVCTETKKLKCSEWTSLSPHSPSLLANSSFLAGGQSEPGASHSPSAHLFWPQKSGSFFPFTDGSLELALTKKIIELPFDCLTLSLFPYHLLSPLHSHSITVWGPSRHLSKDQNFNTVCLVTQYWSYNGH